MSDGNELVPYWGIHSEIDQRPAFCDWRPSESEAQARLRELQQQDPEPNYWVSQMTQAELESHKAGGSMPPDA